jgi:2-polyprenyl-3-methyl-5-hydroxy-6-metoxy-1,4-benzoquinol methylase
MTTDATQPTRETLVKQIEEMRPWHHDIQIREDLCSGEIFSPDKTLLPKENDGVSLISPRERYLEQLDALYPDTLKGKRFLDCACNAGGYCFWSRERDAEVAVGFDVREHWIRQAKFVQEHRVVEPVDRIEFHVMDLYDVPKHDFGKFDMTYFSGIFYHLPDPITGLKIAADMTSDIFVLNTAIKTDENNPTGLTMARESRTKVMSGVHEMSWFPNGPDCLHHLLRWLGFKEMKITLHINKRELLRQRIEMVAAREKGRLANVEGDYFVSDLR